jgi:hypothetical protein
MGWEHKPAISVDGANTVQMPKVIARALLGALLFVSCESVLHEELSGVYVMQRTFATEMLRLDSTGRYTQIILLGSDSIPVYHSGVWELSKDGTTVYLRNGLAVDDGATSLNPNYATPVQGVLSAGNIKKYSGVIWLVNDENDPDAKYRKQ